MKSFGHANFWIYIQTVLCARYKDDATEGHKVVQWLWQTLESFSNDEKILFLRFVSGRSRLPVRISDIPQRFRISIYGQVTLTLKV